MTDQHEPTQPQPVALGASLGAMLGEGLRCAGCRYNLSGLSIRGICPECGLPVQVSILAVVDPHAERLSPLLRPRLIAVSLWLWILGGVVATLLVAWLRLFDVCQTINWLNLSIPPQRSAEIVTIAIGVSGIALFGFARPIKNTRSFHIISTLVGAMLMLCVAFGSWYVLGYLDRRNPEPYISFAQAVRMRSVARLIIAACLVGALVGGRKNLRLLAARSLLFRQGRADRQTIYALVLVVVLAAIGDIMQLISFSLPQRTAEFVWNLGRYVIAFSSVLFVAGVCAVLLDVLLVTRAIVKPPKGLEAYFERTERMAH